MKVFRILPTALFVVAIATVPSCNDVLSGELRQTGKLLKTEVTVFPGGQGVEGFDPVRADAPEFKFRVIEATIEPPVPRPWYETRPSVLATVSDQSEWEAFCGKAGPGIPAGPPDIDFRSESEKNAPKFVESPAGFQSTPGNTRQAYLPHHGYAFDPDDVYIGKREGGRLKTVLFFRDVGSHTTAPHYFAIDSFGWANLVVADVNISEHNNLDLYWMVGDLSTGKWLNGTLVDQRGFTSYSHPWLGVAGTKVHLIWSWDEGERRTPASGLYHVERSSSEFGRKVQFASGDITDWDAAIDATNGRILVAYRSMSTNTISMVFRSAEGIWSRPARADLEAGYLSVAASDDGTFAIRTEAGTVGIEPL